MNWYKQTQSSGYGYHGTDPTRVKNIKTNGLDIGSFFSSNEDDISPYVDEIWLRFPFPSNFNKHTGKGDYYTTTEIIPSQLIEAKTDVWGEYVPL
jgi:hypothetical protein